MPDPILSSQCGTPRVFWGTLLLVAAATEFSGPLL